MRHVFVCGALALCMVVAARAAPPDPDAASSLLLVPDAGHDLVLERLALTGSGRIDTTASRVRIRDTAGRLLWDSGEVTLPPGMSIAMDCEPIRSALPLRVEIRSLHRLRFSALAFGPVPSERRSAAGVLPDRTASD